jgi:hypothetical protein
MDETWEIFWEKSDPLPEMRELGER